MIFRKWAFIRLVNMLNEGEEGNGSRRGRGTHVVRRCVEADRVNRVYSENKLLS